MAVTAQRRLETNDYATLRQRREAYAIPDLTEIQTKSYARFLQYDTPHRQAQETKAWKAFCKEIFPIESYDKTLTLEYLATSSASRATSRTNAGSCG